MTASGRDIVVAGFPRAVDAERVYGSVREERERAPWLQDGAFVQVSGKGGDRVYDPCRSVAGMLTSVLTGGRFGLAASGGSGISFAVWPLVGAVCGGIYAYYTEHIVFKSELKRVGRQLGPDISALMMWAEMADNRSRARRLESAKGRAA